MYFGSILAYGDENSEFQMATKICAISSLSLAAVILVVFTWTSFHRSLQSYSPLPFEQFCLDTPTRVAGRNYPISFIIKFISS